MDEAVTYRKHGTDWTRVRPDPPSQPATPDTQRGTRAQTRVQQATSTAAAAEQGRSAGAQGQESNRAGMVAANKQGDSEQGSSAGRQRQSDTQKPAKQAAPADAAGKGGVPGGVGLVPNRRVPSAGGMDLSALSSQLAAINAPSWPRHSSAEGKPATFVPTTIVRAAGTWLSGRCGHTAACQGACDAGKTPGPALVCPTPLAHHASCSGTTAPTQPAHPGLDHRQRISALPLAALRWPPAFGALHESVRGNAGAEADPASLDAWVHPVRHAPGATSAAPRRPERQIVEWQPPAASTHTPNGGQGYSTTVPRSGDVATPPSLHTAGPMGIGKPLPQRGPGAEGSSSKSDSSFKSSQTAAPSPVQPDSSSKSNRRDAQSAEGMRAPVAAKSGVATRSVADACSVCGSPQAFAALASGQASCVCTACGADSGPEDVLPVQGALVPGELEDVQVAAEQHVQHWLAGVLGLEPPAELYCPENYSREYVGAVTARYALAHSLNAVCVSLADQVGLESGALRGRLVLTLVLNAEPCLLHHAYP